MNQQDILLRQTFHEEMITLYKRTAKELKYKSPRLLEMINKYGGYEAAIKILPTDAHTFDFALMWENQRLDLSIEALVTKDCYKELFPEEIITFCQRRLDEYNYAPNKIVEQVEEELPPFEKEEILKEEKEPSIEEVSEPRQCEDYMPNAITTTQWIELFMKSSIFTAKNQDLIIKIYSTGSLNISPQTLAGLEGYSCKYPFYEVILSLCKRIKAALKIEVPKNDEGKLLWWQFLFTGYYENNQSYLFNLRYELDEALTKLMEEGSIPKVERQMNPEYEALELIQIAPPEPEIEEEVLEEETTTSPKKSIVSPNGEIPSLDDFIDFLISDSPAPKEKSITSNEPAATITSQATTMPKIMAFHSDSLVDEEETVLSTKESEDAVTSITPSNREESKMTSTAPLNKEENEVVSTTLLSKEESEIAHTTSLAKEESLDSTMSSIANKEEEMIESSLDIKHDTLWEDKKKECLDYYGAVCDLCGFDFGYTYGIQFEGLIKVHNLKPEAPLEEVNPQEDLIPICHNCEAVIQAHTPHYTVEEVKTFIEKAKDAD